MKVRICIYCGDLIYVGISTKKICPDCWVDHVKEYNRKRYLRTKKEQGAGSS